MLRSLHIRDFVIVDRAEIQFESGFTVFSGETGAGKSILVDALSLVLGARGDATVLREGAARADISAVFDPPQSLQPWLAERAMDGADVVVLRRVIDSQARSRAFINGLPVTLAQLRELGEFLVDIHGQHAHQSLLGTSSQRELLDTHGGHQALARHVAQARQQWQHATKLLVSAQQNAAALREERERIEWQLADIERLELHEGEWEAIGIDHNRLAHAQALLDGATQALAALDNDDESAQQRLGAASHQIRQLLRHDSHLQGVYDAIESASIATREAVSDLNGYLSRLDLEPERLAQAERRMTAIFDTARKLKIEPEALAGFQQRLRQQLDDSQAATDIDGLQSIVDTAQRDYTDRAEKLSRARAKISKTLAGQVTRAMQSLAMQGGRFDIVLHPCASSSHGNETVEFLVAGHEGTRVKPLAKVASGGELARLSLALSVIASQATRVPTLIFDEVDTGVGGAVADVVGLLLKELGERHQVLCVTHLPQVAARGSHHYEVKKSTTHGATLSAVENLDRQGRINEVARMLGGLKITETTRKHAQEMLEP